MQKKLWNFSVSNGIKPQKEKSMKTFSISCCEHAKQINDKFFCFHEQDFFSVVAAQKKKRDKGNWIKPILIWVVCFPFHGIDICLSYLFLYQFK